MFDISVHTGFFLSILGILGLTIGSFLNVVIHRLPIILKKQWQQECVTYLDQIAHIDTSLLPKISDIKPFSLAYPQSHCPICHTSLKWWQNIPVLSYLLLHFRCATCKNRIPVRYFIVELLSCGIALFAGIEFGTSWTSLFVCIFGWFLIVISFIDIENKLVPDRVTLPLLWSGLLLSCFEPFANSHDAILGAIIGYGFLWSIGQSFQLIRKKEGIGLGDCKLLAAIGAWLGWQILPFIILTSSILGSIFGLVFLFYKKLPRQTQIPFAPFLAIAAWIATVWGFDVTEYYVYFFGGGWTNV